MSLKSIVLSVSLALAGAAANASPEFWQYEWPNTDFEKTSVQNWTEILSGGPPKDGIPALSDPDFIPIASETRIGDLEPVITVEFDGSTPRAYPIRYLTWHEIVNDTFDGHKIAVTFCPLCNSGITFDRNVAGKVLTFGVSGKLRNSDMVMYDRETESWWQQAIGEAIVGDLTGTKLTALPTWMESMAQFKARNPDGMIMDQPKFARSYGRNPYVSYDSSKRPFLYNGEMPPHGISPLARVVRIDDTAWPLTRLESEKEIVENGVRISWQAGQASALDGPSIARSRDVGTVRVRDAATGADLPHDVMFAFAFHAFWPSGNWKLGR